MEIIDSICDRLSLAELERIKPLRDLSLKMNSKASHLGLAAITFLSLLVIFEYGATLISFSVGFIYPAYMSFKAIEKDKNPKSDRLWLTYWVVFAFVNGFDELMRKILAFLPLYSVIKVLFYIWLFHPLTEGALVVYEKIWRGIVIKLDAAIENNLQNKERAEPMLERCKQE